MKNMKIDLENFTSLPPSYLSLAGFTLFLTCYTHLLIYLFWGSVPVFEVRPKLALLQFCHVYLSHLITALILMELC